jgi:hypothetical protein
LITSFAECEFLRRLRHQQRKDQTTKQRPSLRSRLTREWDVAEIAGAGIAAERPGQYVIGRIHRQICEPKIVTKESTHCELFESSGIKSVDAARHWNGGIKVGIKNSAGLVGGDLTSIIGDWTDRPFAELLRCGQVRMKYIARNIAGFFIFCIVFIIRITGVRLISEQIHLVRRS